MRRQKEKKERIWERCIYCGVVLMKHNNQGDHWPVPQSLGGTCIVRACMSCHDLKDRIPIGDLPTNFSGESFSVVYKTLHFWYGLNREEKVIIARHIDSLLRTISLGQDGVQKFLNFLNLFANVLTNEEVRSEYYRTMNEDRKTI